MEQALSIFERVISGLIIGIFLGFAVDAFSADILLSWDHANQREDGSALALDEIDGYRLYQTVNGGAEQVFSTPRVTDYTLIGVEGGEHIFQISTVSLGVEGQRSPALAVNIPKPSANYPIIRVIIERCDLNGNCTQEVVQ